MAAASTTPSAAERGARSAARVLRALGTLLLVAAAVALLTLLAEERETVAGLASAMDGDSLRVGGLEIRLAGIDAPELRQTCTRDERPYGCGAEAKAELARLAEGWVVSCRIEERDRYRRHVATCRVGGEDLGAALVRGGLAISYEGRYRREEAGAKAAKTGLWGGSFVEPAQWRREHPTPYRS